MEIKPIQSWNEFVQEIERLNSIREEYTSKTVVKVSELLYRGQPDSSKKLETTLERLNIGKITLCRYYDFVSVIKSKIESVTGQRWDIPSRDQYAQWCKNESWPFVSFPAGDYFAYLRHHDFPSPLMDWTISPYIAAHFAMLETPKDGVKNFSVYAYLEYAGTKSYDVRGTMIQSLGRYIKTHKRHYLQQSTYTICTSGEGASLSYDSYESVVAMNNDRQDLLWRLDIPVSQRRNFLFKLEPMNINSFSLFGTDDKLMEHIYISEILLRNHL
jgi:hypothetical protein